MYKIIFYENRILLFIKERTVFFIYDATKSYMGYRSPPAKVIYMMKYWEVTNEKE